MKPLIPSMHKRRAGGWWSIVLAVVVAVVLVASWGDFNGGSSASRPVGTVAEHETTVSPLEAGVEKGAYLARVGNCMACHTQRGGAAYAGGRGIATPFGTVYSSNLTPDEETGLGRWSAQQFWLALHEGRSRDGRLLFPAFPYPDYSRITREDSDALYAFFRSLAPVRQPNRAHDVAWPLGSQAALWVWRALYFQPVKPPADPAGNPVLQRGAYLVEGLGHCGSCHSPRGWLGGVESSKALTGGVLPAGQGYAPSLISAQEAGVGAWPLEQTVRLLKAGVNDHAVASGLMAEVVFHSTQYWTQDDLLAVATYLQRREVEPSPRGAAPGSRSAHSERAGQRLYEQHCTSCHGAQGQGVPGAYPALAGNRAVTMARADNVIRSVLLGGFAPATTQHPRPHGMPPFRQLLSDAEVASVVSYIRAAWDNGAPPVSEWDVARSSAVR